MAKTFLPCVCGYSNSKIWAIVNKITLVECTLCGVIRVDKVDKEAYSNLYASGEYHAKGSEDLRHDDAGREPHRTRLAADYEVAVKRLAKIHKYKLTGRLIDVGCANGAFMAVADENGYSVEGIDLSKDAVLDKFKSKVRCGSLREVGFQRRYADIITFNDSFEHFIDPVSALRASCGILKRDGLLVVETPDIGCEEARIQRENFKHVKPHEHLWYFTATQLRNLLEASGFTVIGMDVPVPGKITAYASPSVKVEDIEIIGPPGVGDTLWTLQKLQPIYYKESPCRLRYIVQCDGDEKVVTRARDFLLLCPYIDAVDFRAAPLPRDVGCTDPAIPRYELFPNDYLDPKVEPFHGGLIEDWRPELKDDWEVPFIVPESAIQQARWRLKDVKCPVTVYISSKVWNWTVAEPVWTSAHWAELLVKLADAGMKPVILGSGSDAEYANEVAEKIVEMGRDPSKVWLNTIGRTSLPLAMAYMQLSKLTIGVANGLPMLSLYLGNNAIIFWPVRHISKVRAQFCKEFSRNWCPPDIRNSGRYKDLTVGTFTVEDIFVEACKMVPEWKIQNTGSLH